MRKNVLIYRNFARMSRTTKDVQLSEVGSLRFGSPVQLVDEAGLQADDVAGDGLSTGTMRWNDDLSRDVCTLADVLA